jgi:hypothetical protein
MKKISIIVLLLIFSNAMFSQEENSVPMMLKKQDYLAKSKRQKIVGWTLAGGGFVVGTIGTITLLKNAMRTISNIPADIFGGTPVEEDNNDGSGLIIAGGVAIFSSIPFFVSATKNKQKAINLSFHNQLVPYLQINNLTARSVPSIQLKFNL